jgi:transcriptional regulatory protein LevR
MTEQYEYKAKILIGEHEGQIVEVVGQNYETMWVAYDVKLPNGEIGTYFTSELLFVPVTKGN